MLLEFNAHESGLTLRAEAPRLLAALADLDNQLADITGYPPGPLSTCPNLPEAIEALQDGSVVYQRSDFSTPEDDYTLTVIRQ